MHMSTPLVYAPPPPPTRKPAFKRRRLNNTLDTGSQPTRALTDHSNAAPTVHASSLPLCAKLSCSTCHRALSTAIRPGVAGPPMCSRCAAPTCAICARTCTSYTCPSSIPPTPALTRSPSPSTQVGTPISPKRTTLGLSYATLNRDTSLTLPLPSFKRKKAPVDKVDAERDGHGSHHSHGATSTFTHGALGVRDDIGDGDGTESTVVFGCGRVVCRACCVESVFNDGKLCVDCFALV